jgi:ribosomal protein S18 acetylase RimI-like enzyme
VPGELEIRPIRETEYAAAGDATAQAYREFAAPGRPGFDTYLGRIADIGARARNATVLVAVVDGVIAGSATLELDSRIAPSSAGPLAPDEAHLRMLGVIPELRGRGVARRLVAECVSVARARGKRRLTLETAPVMVGAQRLYTSMGFTAAGEHHTPDGMVLLDYVFDVESDALVTG